MKKLDLEGLSTYFRNRPDVIFSVVFGSASGGSVSETSDVDLGVLFASKPDTDTLLTFLSTVASVLDFDDIDFVDLRTASPLLAFEAINGRYLCKNNPETTAEYCSLISREYEDVMLQLEYQRNLSG